MTEEQYARAQLIHDLKRLVDPDWMQMQYHDLPKLPTFDYFYVHFTDMPTQGRDQFWSTLLSDGLIEFETTIKYQKRGDWMDHFPPSIYRLTAKGRHMVDNPGDYVFAVEGKMK